MARELTTAEKAIIRIIRSDATGLNTTASERDILAAIASDAGLDAILSYSAELYAADQAPIPEGKPERITRGGLTERERAMIVKIAESEYMDGGPEGTTWARVVCESQSDGAVLGSLGKKGLIRRNYYGGDKREDTIRLTKCGLMAYRVERPEGDYAKECDRMEEKQIAAERSHPNL